jgi:catechol 2,3-dioxygenase-like lactoylglutathione lyase family enzyme
MKVESITPILNVSDVPASIALFRKLGWTLGFAWNDSGPIEPAADRNAHGPAHFAGVCCVECQIFLCKDGQRSRGGPAPRHVSGDDDTGGVWMSWWLSWPAEVDEVHALAQREGITVTWPPTDERWGVRECHIVHPDGHTFRISAGLSGA